MAAFGGVAGFLLAIFGFLVWNEPEPSPPPPPTSEPLHVVGRGPLGEVPVISADDRRRHLRLSDGSVLDIRSGAALETISNTGEAVELRALRGRVLFDVHPGGSRRWVVDAGLARIEVTGTVFVVDRAPRSVEVTVERGSVIVRSDRLQGGWRRLAAGESLEIRLPEEPEAEPAAEPAAEPDAGHSEDDEAQTEGEDHHAETPSRASWRELAAQGEYREAYDLLGAGGVSRETRRAATMDELLALADVARLSGHPADALDPLERALSTYPTDRRATVAAFTIGRLELDVMGRPNRAARAFERCIALGAPQALQADAYARLAQARVRVGNHGRAREAAAEYLRLFPNGRRAEDMRRLLEPPSPE